MTLFTNFILTNVSRGKPLITFRRYSCEGEESSKYKEKILINFWESLYMQVEERTISFSTSLYSYMQYKKKWFFPLVEVIPEQLRSTFFWGGKLILSLLLSKLLFSLGYLLMDDLQRAVAQFYPSASGGMFDGSCPSPAPGPIGNYEVLGASIADNDNDPNPPGSPSVSEEFGFLRMPTPEFREMVSAFDSVFDSVQEPLLSDEQRRQELSDRLTFMVENGVESTMILSL